MQMFWRGQKDRLLSKASIIKDQIEELEAHQKVSHAKTDKSKNRSHLVIRKKGAIKKKRSFSDG